MKIKWWSWQLKQQFKISRRSRLRVKNRFSEVHDAEKQIVMYSYECSVKCSKNCKRNGPRNMRVQYALFHKPARNEVEMAWKRQTRSTKTVMLLLTYYIFQMPHGIGFLGHVCAARVIASSGTCCDVSSATRLFRPPSFSWLLQFRTLLRFKTMLISH